ncbi:MAG: DUF655 domain-containing protein [Crenarchaeota archaeon]|nr:DUF655 domain-containing protein [Thermoproteota archaeon]
MRRARRRERPKEGRVLDFLPSGRPLDSHPEHRDKPFIQALEEHKFKLVEFSAKYNVSFDVGEKVSFTPLDERLLNRYYYVGYDELTSVAQASLPEVIKNIILENERLFVEFFNVSEPITLRLHAIELLPGVGRKLLQEILEARKAKPFESFEDISKRTHLKHPVEALVERIIKEIKGEEKYYLFAEPPKPGGTYLNYLARLRASLRTKGSQA